jgi:hypothetical protein
VKKEFVGFVGGDHQLDMDVTLGPELLDDVRRLLEGDVAVVVAVDEQDGRRPGGDAGDG